MRAVTGEDLDLKNDYNFLMLCNDYIVDILKLADLKQWSSEKIDIKQKDIKKFNSQKYDLFYWRKHGYATSINKSIYKHMFFSLVADYNIYVSDAIDCATKYHFGTAFSLLRKPFKDDLLLLEILYTKGHRFVPEFLNKPIGEFAIDAIAKNPNKLKKVLRKSCKKLNFFTGKRMYDLRYSKQSKESLEKIWNKTSHIITTHNQYATENGNLNIIFATDDIVEENLVYFFKVCCNIQLYFIQLLFHFLKEENLISEVIFNNNMNKLYFAFSCILDEEVLREIIKTMTIKCDNCGYKFKVTKEILKMNNKNKTFNYNCKKCNKETKISGFVYD